MHREEIIQVIWIPYIYNKLSMRNLTYVIKKHPYINNTFSEILGKLFTNRLLGAEEIRKLLQVISNTLVQEGDYALKCVFQILRSICQKNIKSYVTSEEYETCANCKKMIDSIDIARSEMNMSIN